MDEKLSANQFTFHKFANETRGRSDARNLYIDHVLCTELKNKFKDLIPRWAGAFWVRQYYLSGTEWYLYRRIGGPPQLITIR